jgi:hypothetical protein
MATKAKDAVLDIDGCPIDHLVSWYLMASYLYYHQSLSPITDEQFDKICRRLRDNLDTVTHQHKDLLDWGALDAGTGYHLTQEMYPNMVKHAAFAWRDHLERERAR